MITSEMQNKLVVLKMESVLKKAIEKILEQNIIDTDIRDMMEILDIKEEYLKQLYIKNIIISNMEKVKSLSDMNNVSYEFIFGLKNELSDIINTNTLFRIFIQNGGHKFEAEIDNAEKRLNLTESDINLLMIIQRILTTIILIKINEPIKNFTYSNINKNPINSEKLKKTWNLLKNL